MKAYVTVIVLDVLLLLALYFVFGDLQSRVAYAQSPHGRTSGYAASFSLSLFTRIFTMLGNGANLVSPPTLDWVQVLVAALVVVNAWFVYDAYRNRRPGLGRSTSTEPPATPQ